jgi:hypothetical protein
MPADYARAAAFVLEYGDEVVRTMLNNLEGGDVYEVPPSDEVKRTIFDGQRPDSGWAPFWAPDYSSLDATCFRLAQAELAWIGKYSPEFGSALDFLRARQRPDGSWEEDESVRELAPPWAKPGDLAARLYLTANCGWWLINAAAYDGASYTGEAARAGAYLVRHLALDGSLPSFLQTYWLAAALWIRLNWPPPPVSALARRALDHLASLLDNTVPGGALGWMVTTLAPLGVAPEHPAVAKALALLAEQQRADGGWTSEDGPDRDAYVTAQALMALIQWRAL